MPSVDQVVRVLVHDPGQFMRIYMRDDVFADGYCDCRCGPDLHKARYDNLAGELLVVCAYHQRGCAQWNYDKIRTLAERLMP